MALEIGDNCTFYNSSKLQTKKIDLNSGYIIEKVEKEVLDKLLIVHMNSFSFSLLVDPRVMYIINKNKETFIVWRDQVDCKIFTPSCLEDVEKMVRIFPPLINCLHKNKCIHYNLTPNSFYVNESLNQYSLKDYKKLTYLSSFYKQSPVIGSIIISPLHLIIEMLFSKIEPISQTKADFKHKFNRFYNAVSNKQYLNVLNICQKYFGLKYGAIDYIEYILKKFCVFDENGNILKKVEKLDFYRVYMDWFAFGIILHNYMTVTIKPSEKPSKYLIDFITSCLTYESFDSQ